MPIDRLHKLQDTPSVCAQCAGKVATADCQGDKEKNCTVMRYCAQVRHVPMANHADRAKSTHLHVCGTRSLKPGALSMTIADVAPLIRDHSTLANLVA